MGGIIGKVTDTIGLTDNKGAKKAANAASDATDLALKLGKQQIALMKEGLDFQKKQYDDWKLIYGDVEKNLGDYYKNLNANDITAMGLQNSQAEYQTAVREIKMEAAQRGASNSGMEFSTVSRAALDNAKNRADIRTKAPMEVAREKLNFLQIGLGQQGQINQGIVNAYGQVSNAYTNQISTQTQQAGQYLQLYNNLKQSNMDTMGTIVGGAARGFTGGFF